MPQQLDSFCCNAAMMACEKACWLRAKSIACQVGQWQAAMQVFSMMPNLAVQRASGPLSCFGVAPRTS